MLAAIHRLLHPEQLTATLPAHDAPARTEELAVTRPLVSQHASPKAKRSACPAGTLVTTTGGSSYTIESQLGFGGLGTVYRARRRADGLLVALKLPQHEAFWEMLRREGEILAQLSHPHIVSLVEYGQTSEGCPVIAMELLEGQTLDRLIRQEGPLGLARARAICLQTAEAISYAHDKGIVHRDIKPANIMVVNSAGVDLVYVLDFGISGPEQTGGGGEDETTGGSLCYMAPEQILKLPYTRQSDVYQLALVLFECLTGRLPFDVSFASAVMYRITGEVLGQARINALDSIHPALAALIERGLARDPVNRPASMSAFSACLAGFLSPVKVPA